MYGNNIGDMAWMDLSVSNAKEVKDFYQNILGWQSDAMKMSDNGQGYDDYVMKAAKVAVDSDCDSTEESSNESAQFVTGICHAKGANADMPATWLPYFLVENIDIAVEQVETQGGELVTAIKNIGDDRYVVIKDPAGATCALYQKA
jgi:predicted enzyme related to lactoylglutathione lyase